MCYMRLKFFVGVNEGYVYTPVAEQAVSLSTENLQKYFNCVKCSEVSKERQNFLMRALLWGASEQYRR